MPVIFTFDISGNAQVGGQDFRGRVQAAFQRLGWQHLGGTAYRYPTLDAQHVTEDWFNHVVPALMLFRAMAIQNNIQIDNFTVDVQASTGFDQPTGVGTAPVTSAGISFYPPNHANLFGEQNLRDWIDSIPSPY